MSGKEIRLKRIFDRKSGKAVILPVDHGATLGPVNGIQDVGEFLSKLDERYVNGVVLCKGNMLNRKVITECNVPKIVHLSNASVMSYNPDFKTLVGSVESAIALGGDAISVHVNIGDRNDHVMLGDFAKIADDCFRWGMPLLAMMYIKNNESASEGEKQKIAVRIAQEAGADIVKVNYTGDQASFAEVVNGCSIPVLIAGGDSLPPEKSFQNAYDAIKAGASGIAYGRNIFQSEEPQIMCEALSMIVHKHATVEQALDHLRKSSEKAEV